MSAIYFEIQADDVKRASGFYTAVFGWKFSEVEGLPSRIGTLKPAADPEEVCSSVRPSGLRRNAARTPLSAPLRSTISIESRRKY